MKNTYAAALAASVGILSLASPVFVRQLNAKAAATQLKTRIRLHAQQVAPTQPRSFDSWPAPIEVGQDKQRESSQQFFRLVRGDHERKLLALTFDDGPHGPLTVDLLRVLRLTHTRATFFVIGKQVDKYPQLVREEMQDGHEVGNHTYDHVNLTQIPPELIGYELDECNRAIKRASGTEVHFFRPPGGDYNVDVLRAATHRDIVTTLWTDDPGDYAHPGADVILQRTLDHLENGGIILLHDGIPETIDVLPAIIAEARKRGYEFVTVSELKRDR
jgi:peptidoglycan-N-acetylglucosamine deacetylase